MCGKNRIRVEEVKIRVEPKFIKNVFVSFLENLVGI